MAEKSEGGGFAKALKKYLITGILVWLPVTVTVWVIGYIISATDSLINLIPAKWQPVNYLGFNIPGLGFIIAILVLFLTGLFGANVLGKKILLLWDSLLSNIPVVKSIYSSVKKVSESLLSDNGRSFKTPVLVPFPHQGIRTIAFVSGSLPDKIKAQLEAGETYVPVYVPTTPNPTGGYYIMVKRSDIIELDMSVDDALKYVISLGMVVPDDLPVKSAAEPIAVPSAASADNDSRYNN